MSFGAEDKANFSAWSLAVAVVGWMVGWFGGGTRRGGEDEGLETRNLNRQTAEERGGGFH